MSEYQNIINDLQTSLMRSTEQLEAQRQMYLELQMVISRLTEQARQSELGRLYLLQKVTDIETERQHTYLVARDLAQAAEKLGESEPPAVGAWHHLFNAIQRFKGISRD